MLGVSMDLERIGLVKRVSWGEGGSWRVGLWERLVCLPSLLLLDLDRDLDDLECLWDDRCCLRDEEVFSVVDVDRSMRCCWRSDSSEEYESIMTPYESSLSSSSSSL